ncbi:MAG: TIGR00730 family Rossman fold protein [Chitinophagaceae bacterium]|jgi:hypothetical protein|nr:TIGR00730 family Rossman fold protein [Chitinophagaceae bacterium]
MINRICVYCASSNQVASKYFDAARTLGEMLALEKISVVYGGGATGLMGELATSALRAGGHVIGIMPDFMREVEWAHREVKEFLFVGDMHERKKKFLEYSDALVALPGGCGTFEELLEAITLKRLGLFLKPIVIFNQDGYYNPLLEMLNRAVAEKFMGENHKDIWKAVDRVEDILPAIRETPDWNADALHQARLL